MGYATKEQAAQIIAALDADKAKRIDEMPDIPHALRVFTRAYRRLIELGFKEIIYVPKDGSTFEVIEPGSTGIFPCNWQEEPARGSFWIHEDGGSPSHPVLWRPKQERECKGGKCPEPQWCRNECECLWDRWNKPTPDTRG